MTTWDKEADKDKETLIEYDIKGKEKTPSNSEKKENVCAGYVHMFECGKDLLHSTYECACVAHDRIIIQMK